MEKPPPKPEKMFLEMQEPKEGDRVIHVIAHGPECPRTKLEFGEAGGGPCAHATQSAGPAQVATDSYRAGYDRIFGTRPEVGQA